MTKLAKITFISAIVAISVLFISSIFSWNRIQAQAQQSNQLALETVLRTTHQALVSWSREEQAAAVVWSASPSVLRLTQSLLSEPRTPQSLLASPAQAELRALLGSVLQARGYRGFFIIAPDGASLASSRDANVGSTNLLLEQSEVVDKMWAGESVISLPQPSDVPLPDAAGQLRPGQPTMFVGSPILDGDNRAIALLTFRLDPFRDYTDLFQRGRIGDTGETYAFDANGLLVSESRFDPQLREIGLIGPDEFGLLNIGIRDPGRNLLQTGFDGVPPDSGLPLTRMAASAVAGDNGADVIGYRDYRGVNVIGAWLWDAEHQIGITTELDYDEAYRSLQLTGDIILLLTCLASLLIFGLAFFFVFHQYRETLAAQSSPVENPPAG